MPLNDMLILAGVLGLLLFVGLFTGRKDVAALPPPSSSRYGLLIVFTLVCVVGAALLWPTLSSSLTKGVSTAFQSHAAAPQTTQAIPSDSVQGDPDVSASFIENVLVQAHSPAQGLGQFIYDEGKQYHIKPSFALAVFHMESDYGLKGVAPTLHSIGDIRNGSNGYRSYISWQDSVTDFYQVIRAGYIAKGLTTVAQIMPIYAPAADANNPTQYIQVVRSDMSQWAQRG